MVFTLPLGGSEARLCELPGRGAARERERIESGEDRKWRGEEEKRKVRFVGNRSKEPYAVDYPLLLIGAILALVCGLNLHALRRRYQQTELQKMAAMDAGVRG